MFGESRVETDMITTLGDNLPELKYKQENAGERSVDGTFEAGLSPTSFHYVKKTVWTNRRL